jgi:hypothetical protein
MEVQKHPHHVMHKKNWGEYFLEFLMLFLAVFLGFVAENLREHSEERHRAKEYIESFYQDLKSDTTRINWNIDFDGGKVAGLKNIGGCYDSLLGNSKDASCLVDVIRVTAVNRPFIRTERTLKQLGNAGGFRLLRPEDADSILSYEEQLDVFQDFQTTIYQDIQNTTRNTLNTIGNFKANNQMFRPVDGKMIVPDALTKTEVTAPLLFSADKAALNKYFNELQLYYRVVYNHRMMLLQLKEHQMRLMDFFKKKYGFE